MMACFHQTSSEPAPRSNPADKPASANQTATTYRISIGFCPPISYRAREGKQVTRRPARLAREAAAGVLRLLSRPGLVCIRWSKTPGVDASELKIWVIGERKGLEEELARNPNEVV